ncbi:MAG: hypothetical protein FJZ01_00125 [Candidatus Sericytochromatia bacterium]|nr:hypothetical protein [Candidatus Tanganyikabacteria bacterium]
MALSNCPRCGKTFNKLPNVKICRDCQDIEDAQFEKVYQFLRDNPKTQVSVISEQTQVKESLILEWFRTGRLMTGNSDVRWTCEKCGAEIDRGRLCKRCAGAVMGGIGDALAPQGGEAEDAPQQQGRRTEFGHELRSDKYAR